MKTLITLGLIDALIWYIIVWYYLRNRNIHRRNRNIHRRDSSYNPVKIEFHHIKPVALTGRIRVFSNWGNHLADISEAGAIVYISSKSIGQEAEIRYIIDNYKKVWKSLVENDWAGI